MIKNLEKDLLAEVAERLIKHLQSRNDVQNIDLMNLSGFCRNCLSKWYVDAAQKKNINIEYEDARELIYGIPYKDWKNKFQIEASNDQIESFKKK